MLNFIKKYDKPVFIVAVISAAVLSGAATFGNLAAFQNNELHQKSAAIEAVNGNTVDGTKYGLPAHVTLSTPIMYDFINGSLGLNEGYVDMVKGGRAFIAVNDTKPDEVAIHIVYLPYNLQDSAEKSDIDKLLPIFSTAPDQYKFSSLEEKETYLAFVKGYREHYADLEAANNVAETQIVKEGDYTFYIADAGVVKPSPDTELFNARTLARKKGLLQTAIDDGMGIPTYIIRKKCNLEDLKNFSKETDFTLPFWDTVNYNERLKCYKKGSTTDYVVLSPTLSNGVSDNKVWAPTYSINRIIQSPLTSLDDIDASLAKYGFESIQETLTRGEYSKDLEGTVELWGTPVK